MTTQELLQTARMLHTKYKDRLYPAVVIGLFISGTLLILIGIFFSKSNPVQAKTSESSSSKNVQKNSESQESSSSTIMVDVAGAVVKPGVYTLKSGDRLSVALEAAGGFDKKVSKNFVAHSLNLSQKLTDEQKIYIPYQNEKLESDSVVSPTVQSSSKSNNSQINVNSSSQAELETLTGVGAVRAQSIISGRPFKSLQELVQKGILTQKIFNDNKDKMKI